MPRTTRQWIYGKAVENDALVPECFALREVTLPEPKDGELLVRVRLINIHSHTRMRMSKQQLPVGETERGSYACAEVLESRAPHFQPGDIIACQAGWQEYQIIDTKLGAMNHGHATELVKALQHTGSPWTYAFRPALAKMWNAETLMSVFGTSGLTAYFGLRECGPIMPRDRVLVAAATGAVGSLAAQLAKAAGARVVGLAGGAARSEWAVKTLGIDACLDYRAPDLDAQLKSAFPEGVDVFSDGVGGALTEMVIDHHLKQDSRLLSYGGSSVFYADRYEGAGPASLAELFGITKAVIQKLARKNIKNELWMVDAFYHERTRAEDDLSRLLTMGKLKPIVNVVEGFEKLPQGISDLYRSPREGKLQIRFSA